VKGDKRRGNYATLPPAKKSIKAVFVKKQETK
jgi:hypothetical protein